MPAPHHTSSRSLKKGFFIFLSIFVLTSCKGPRFTYATFTDVAGEQSLGADVVTPEITPPDEGFPVVLLIHGGGWSSKGLYDDGIGTTINRLAAAGYTGVTINYRLTSQRVNESGELDDTGTITRNQWPAQLEDAKCAVRWIRANANDTAIFPQKINPAKIGVMGISAGGQIALMLGETGHAQQYENAQCPHAATSEVQAVVSYAGLADAESAWGTTQNLIRPMYQRLLSLWSEPDLLKTGFSALDDGVAAKIHGASPSHFVAGNTTPVRLIHAIDDILVPPSSSSCFYNALATTGRERSVLWFAKGGHLFNENTREHADKQMIDWFDLYLKGIAGNLPCIECTVPEEDIIRCPWN